MICDRIVVAKTNEKLYKTIIKPSILHGREMVALTKRQEAELKILTRVEDAVIFVGVTRMDIIINQYIRGTEQNRKTRRHCKRDEIDQIWVYVEKGCVLCRKKAAKNGATRQ